MLVYIYNMHEMHVVALMYLGGYGIVRYLYRESIPKKKRIIPRGFLKFKTLFNLLSDDLNTAQKWQVMAAIVFEVLFFVVMFIVIMHYHSVFHR